MELQQDKEKLRKNRELSDDTGETKEDRNRQIKKKTEAGRTGQTQSMQNPDTGQAQHQESKAGKKAYGSKEASHASAEAAKKVTIRKDTTQNSGTVLRRDSPTGGSNGGSTATGVGTQLFDTGMKLTKESVEVMKNTTKDTVKTSATMFQGKESLDHSLFSFAKRKGVELVKKTAKTMFEIPKKIAEMLTSIIINIATGNWVGLLIMALLVILALLIILIALIFLMIELGIMGELPEALWNMLQEEFADLKDMFIK